MTPPQAHANQFLFAYPFTQVGLQVAEIKGICTVDAGDALGIALYRSDTGEKATPEAALRLLIIEWLRTEMAESLALARNLGRCNSETHDRELDAMARRAP